MYLFPDKKGGDVKLNYYIRILEAFYEYTSPQEASRIYRQGVRLLFRRMGEGETCGWGNE